MAFILVATLNTLTNIHHVYFEFVFGMGNNETFTNLLIGGNKYKFSANNRIILIASIYSFFDVNAYELIIFVFDRPTVFKKSIYYYKREYALSGIRRIKESVGERW